MYVMPYHVCHVTSCMKSTYIHLVLPAVASCVLFVSYLCHFFSCKMFSVTITYTGAWSFYSYTKQSTKKTKYQKNKNKIIMYI